jgi:hypothetical protein
MGFNLGQADPSLTPRVMKVTSINTLLSHIF